MQSSTVLENTAYVDRYNSCQNDPRRFAVMLTHAMKMVIRIGVEVDMLYFILFRLLLRHMAASHQIS